MIPKLPLLAVRYVAEQLRESLPSTEGQAGPFVSGMAWAFAVHWTLLIAITWWWSVTR